MSKKFLALLSSRTRTAASGAMAEAAARIPPYGAPASERAPRFGAAVEAQRQAKSGKLWTRVDADERGWETLYPRPSAQIRVQEIPFLALDSHAASWTERWRKPLRGFRPTTLQRLPRAVIPAQAGIQ